MSHNAETRPGQSGGSQEDRRGSRSQTSMPEGQPVRATPGWPPVAIPGRPGWRRHCIDGRQVDLQTTEHQQDRAPEFEEGATWEFD